MFQLNQSVIAKGGGSSTQRAREKQSAADRPGILRRTASAAEGDKGKLSHLLKSLPHGGRHSTAPLTAGGQNLGSRIGTGGVMGKVYTSRVI